MYRSYARLWIVLSVFAVTADSRAVGPYHVTNLGILPSFGKFDDSMAYGINNAGQVVGSCYSSFGSVVERAFLWSPTTSNGTIGEMIGLSPMYGSPAMRAARSINDSGQVAGYGPAGTIYSHATIWSPTTPNSTSGSIFDIGDLPGGLDRSNSYAINSAGQVVGEARGEESPAAFVWTPSQRNGSSGTMVDIGVLPTRSDYSGASAINSFGQVAGGSTNYTLGRRAFLWTPDRQNGQIGSMIDLGPGPNAYESTSAFAMNDFGQVVGFESGPGVGTRGFLWTPTIPNGTSGAMIDVGYLPDGDHSSAARGINSLGNIVGDSTVGLIPGQSTNQQHHAFIWTPDTSNGVTGEMVDLNTVLDPLSGAGWVVEFAHGINDRGQIVGVGSYDSNGSSLPRPVTRAFLLTPIVPEPNALILCALGMSLVLLPGLSRTSRGRV